jgi:hypothetical protein
MALGRRSARWAHEDILTWSEGRASQAPSLFAEGPPPAFLGVFVIATIANGLALPAWRRPCS